MKLPYRPLALAALVVTLVFLVFGSVSTGIEQRVSPRWTLAFDQAGKGSPDPKTSQPLRLPGMLVYVDAKGSYRVFPLADQAAVHGQLWAPYRASGDGPLEIRRADGSLYIGLEEGRGFPVLQDDGFGMVSRGGTDLAWYDADGVIGWKRSVKTPLLGIAELPSGEVVLYDLEGVLTIVGPTGTVIGSRIPPASVGKTGYGFVRLSDSTIAVVEGIEPQYLTCLSLSKGQFETRWSIELGRGFRRDVLITGISGGTKILVEAVDGFRIVDVEDGSSLFCESKGWLRKTMGVPGTDQILTLRDSLEGSYIEAWDGRGYKFYSLGPLTPLYDFAIGSDRVLYTGYADGVAAWDWGNL